MKVKTNELSGDALDWVVAKCEGFVDFDYGGRCFYDDEGMAFEPSCVWAQGGLIIERERIYLQPEIGKEGAGNAWYAVSMYNTDAYGSTPLIAAMRCYVASKLGDEVEVTDELLENEQ